MLFFRSNTQSDGTKGVSVPNKTAKKPSEAGITKIYPGISKGDTVLAIDGNPVRK